MVPADDSDTAADAGDSNRAAYVYCPDCGSKASADWSFCRSCEASIDDVEPADTALVVRTDGEDVDLSEFLGAETGCEKCGHAEAAVEDVAASSDGFPRLLDVQNRRYMAASCTRCGYTEFYKGLRPAQALALFGR